MSCFPAVAEEDNDLEGETMEETKETKNIMEEGNREKDEAVDVKKDWILCYTKIFLILFLLEMVCNEMVWRT